MGEPTEPKSQVFDEARCSSASDVVAPRPYEKPRLVRLGSVRELTWGGSSGIAEGAGTFVMAM